MDRLLIRASGGAVSAVSQSMSRPRRLQIGLERVSRPSRSKALADRRGGQVASNGAKAARIWRYGVWLGSSVVTRKRRTPVRVIR
jgi:hypothetical protein